MTVYVRIAVGRGATADIGVSSRRGVRHCAENHRVCRPGCQCRRAAEVGGEVAARAARKACDRCRCKVGACRHSRTAGRSPDGNSDVRSRAGATAAEQIHVHPCELSGDAGFESLACPTRAVEAEATVRHRRILLIDARSIQQGDIARAAGKVAIRWHAALKVRLRIIYQATAGRCKRQGKILRGGQAIVHHNAADCARIVARKAGAKTGISAGGQSGEAVNAIHISSRCPASQRHGRAVDGVAAARSRHRALQRAGSHRSATWETERANARIEGQSGHLVVHVGVPEGAAIHIERHGAVIAPARAARCSAVSRLRSSAFDERLLGLSDGIDWIASQASCIADSWI